MKYLVTGGMGFIGSHLVNYLMDNNHEVIILDNLSSGTIKNINFLPEFVHGDIRDQSLLGKLMNKVQGCFHLAAIASVDLSRTQWYEANQINLGGTINIFEQAAKNSIKVVYASSAAVYGKSHLPSSEFDTPSPISSYGLDKLSCELQAQIGFKLNGLRSTGLRFFNVYGPKQNLNSDYSGVINKFISCIKNNRNIKIFGNGQQSRDFVYVSDIIKSLVTAMNVDTTNFNIFNVCTGNKISIKELAEMIIKITESKIKIEYAIERPGDIKYSVGNPDLSFENLGLKCSVKIQEGIKKIIL